MPKGPVIDREVVRAALAKHKSANAAAIALGMRPNSVLAISRELAGHCGRCGGDRDSERQYCSTCAAYMREHVKRIRRERKAAGTCCRCSEPIEVGSTAYCAEHRRIVNLEHRERTARQRRSNPVAFKRLQSRSNRKQLYGEAGVRAWERSGERCEVCGSGRDEHRIHIHHLDLDKTHNTDANLICLCSRCHMLLHKLKDHPRLGSFLAWFRAHYAEVPV